MKQAYFLSGLGADHRLFQRQLEDHIPLKIIEWKIPQNNESIENYARRMAEEIPKDVPVIIGGVSFGGMVAIEMSKYLKVEKIILISSIKSYKELPYRIKIWKYIPLYKFLSTAIIKRSGIVLKFVFGDMTKEEEKDFINMLADAHPYFIKWAIHQILNWKTGYKGTNIIQIHGTSDFTFPINKIIPPVIKITNGTHIMVFTNPVEVNNILRKELEE